MEPLPFKISIRKLKLMLERKKRLYLFFRVDYASLLANSPPMHTEACVDTRSSAPRPKLAIQRLRGSNLSHSIVAHITAAARSRCAAGTAAHWAALTYLTPPPPQVSGVGEFAP